jgi:hypothetical protein
MRHGERIRIRPLTGHLFESASVRQTTPLGLARDRAAGIGSSSAHGQLWAPTVVTQSAVDPAVVQYAQFARRNEQAQASHRVTASRRARSRSVSAGRQASVFDPRFDVVGEPHLAPDQFGDRRREVTAAGELIDALPAEWGLEFPDREAAPLGGPAA